ncbi:hypothetical protein [Nocardioides speluncae]|uniref:hypothetical protein n=1 Tax=Nocardioides speluncae TaxID=2670337 RepID=UPI000D68BDF2|nr:hypothetical protein [Nocardioides speluncae]
MSESNKITLWVLAWLGLGGIIGSAVTQLGVPSFVAMPAGWFLGSLLFYAVQRNIFVLVVSLVLTAILAVCLVMIELEAPSAVTGGVLIGSIIGLPTLFLIWAMVSTGRSDRRTEAAEAAEADLG